MSYLRGPLTRDEIGRLKSAGPAVPPVPAESSLAEGPPLLPAPFEPLYLPRHGGGLAHVHLVVKHAVRYKGAGETVGLSAWPLAGATAAEALEAERFEVEEETLEDAAPEGLEYGAVPEWLDGGAAKAIEKALRDRLPDKLAARVYADPLIGERSGPGETREDFARRLRASGGGEAAEKVREQLEKKKTALKVLEEEVEGRRQEKWFAVGKAVLRMTGLLGRRRSSSGVSTVLTKDRLEDKAEARLEAARAVLADLERELAEILDVDPRRLQEETLTPGRGGVQVLRRDLVWVY